MWQCQKELLTYYCAGYYKGNKNFRGRYDSETPFCPIVPHKQCVFVHALICLTVDHKKKTKNTLVSVLNLTPGQQVQYFPGNSQSVTN